MKCPLIYRIVFENGKNYGGQTWNFGNRKKAHILTAYRKKRPGSKANPNKERNLVHKAMRKYKYRFEVLHSFDPSISQKTLDFWEKTWIYLLGSFHDTGWGYNLTKGGSGGIMSKATKEKISKTKKGKKNSKEHNKNIADAKTGKKHSAAHKAAISKSMTDEVRAKISKTKKGKKLSKEHKRKTFLTNQRKRYEKFRTENAFCLL